ncbi:hypothetical protein L9F63_014531 [Diploptera punctata]|uniref:Myb-like domain-containing protein n=1 Tax=Diploptera punctata TaxID=6984 RepID=A0AAD8A7U7_DIPPU|nr:hypothetical protein L9F63_014531 [Diploptera punctata]
MEEEIIMVPEDSFNASVEKFVWSRPMVLSLIEEYKKVEHEFKDSNIKKKHIWRKIAQRLVEKGYPNVTEDMCDKKWRNLKKTFKEIYVGQRGSPLRTRWGFYNAVEEIFSKDPNIVSAASVSVSTKPFLTTKKIPGPDGQEMRVEVMEVVGNLDEEYLEDGEAVIADNTEEQVYGNFDTSNQQPPVWFTEFIQQYHQDEERRIEMLNKMHADIVALEEKKCALLATLIEKLGGPCNEEENKCESTQFETLDQDETAGLMENYQ